MNKKIIFIILSLVVALSSCNDWTDTESLDLGDPSIESNNPALYKKYLENLRKYKESDHNVVYAWLDNSSTLPIAHASHMDYLPDSIDYIVLNRAENLADWEINEMEQVRKKSTKVLTQIDFDAIKLEYDLMIQDKIDEGIDISKEPTFISTLVNKTNTILTAIDTYNYDGLIICYKGKSILHMTQAEKDEYLAYQNAFMSIALKWSKNNQDKLFVFSGNPQNVIYDLPFDSFKHIIIPTTSALNQSGVTYHVSMALVEGVPTDRIVVTADMTSLDEADSKTGYWSDGSRSITSTAYWVVSSHESFNSVGIGIYNTSNDYYNPKFIFPTVREAISILNPSFK